jgi:hypothetical protein
MPREDLADVKIGEVLSNFHRVASSLLNHSENQCALIYICVELGQLISQYHLLFLGEFGSCLRCISVCLDGCRNPSEDINRLVQVVVRHEPLTVCLYLFNKPGGHGRSLEDRTILVESLRLNASGGHLTRCGSAGECRLTPATAVAPHVAANRHSCPFPCDPAWKIDPCRGVIGVQL